MNISNAHCSCKFNACQHTAYLLCVCVFKMVLKYGKVATVQVFKVEL